MKASIVPGYDKCRQQLSELVPLKAPFTLFITPSQLCNFRCGYCTQSLSLECKQRLGFRSELLNYDLFLRLAEQSAEFPGKLKRVLLTGLGEPLTNPRIADMVAVLSKLGVAEKYEIFTNASLLEREVTDRLLSAGLTCLRISVQGTSPQKYKDIAGIDMDFKRFVDNIAYFYRERGDCKVYIKIIDKCLDNEEDKEKFFELFGDVSDYIFVEHLVKAQPSMGDYGKEADNEYTFYGEDSEVREVCPYMFYTLQTDAHGNVFPCPPLGLPLSFSLGNVRENNLLEIWNGEKLKNLRMAHLSGNRAGIGMCGQCGCYLSFTPKEDNLDNDSKEILKRIRASAGENG
jgi:MoaA/NifB/PqqE/SkfB family radical SAM enzyme